MIGQTHPTPPTDDTQELTEKEVLERLREVVRHGYGHLEVAVRDHRISTLQWQKTLVRGGNKTG